MSRDRGLRYWLPSYLAELAAKRRALRKLEGKTVHVFFLICDHFEPKHGTTATGQDRARMQIWQREFPAFFERCRAAFGHGPRYTWFYPPHHGVEHLTPLAHMVYQGYGEIELHLHHDGDTSASLRKLLKDTLAAYHRRGLLLTAGAEPRPSFGFIHGDWALDNSCGGKYCGVNDELTLLRELGCWGDFTMPSANECQTRKINSIYYAVDDPARAKSHDRGVDLRVGTTPPPLGLFMMQGPLGVNMGAPGHPRLENASLTSQNWGRPDRAKAWLRAHVHVKDRPDWVFIKLHAHGAVEKDYDALFGERAWKMHEHLNSVYNDGDRYALHYVTAREAYNLCKTAELGLDGDPEQFRNYVLPPPPSTNYFVDAEHDLRCCSEAEITITNIAAGRSCLFRSGMIPEIRGHIGALSTTRQGELRQCTIEGAAGDVAVRIPARDAAGMSVAAGIPAGPAAPQGEFAELRLLPRDGQIRFTV